MCGIVAVIGPSRPDAAQFSQAVDLLQHRGPDDRGEAHFTNTALGNRRLAILDLSPSGHQPMADTESGLTITFNGEIYNYLEIRAELQTRGHVFRSGSDTEVLLHAYKEWGTEALQRLNGMFAFVIWNPRDNTAFFARDRLGVKPCYYAMHGGTLFIASEPKAILHLRPELRVADDTTLVNFLAFGQLHGGANSFYRGIAILPAAHCGTFKPGEAEPHITRYWSLDPSADPVTDATEAEQRFATLFDDAVKLRLRSDVPVGLTLSGGLDSSSVLHSAATQLPVDGHTFTAFTSVYEGSDAGLDEREWAALAAARYSNVVLQPVAPNPAEWTLTLPEIVWHMDSPGSSPAVFPLWHIMREARRSNIPVLLEGQGSDELLGGYDQYTALAIRQLAFRAGRTGSPTALRQAINAIRAKRGAGAMIGMWFLRDQFPSLLPAYRRRFGGLGVVRHELLNGNEPPQSNARDIQQRLRDDLTRFVLPSLLQYGDAISAAHSIESRLPFLDYRLVEYCASMSVDLKLDVQETKKPVRRYLQSAGQTQIATRRDKKGYPTPVNRWMAADSGGVLREYLCASSAQIHTYCEPAKLTNLVDRFLSGDIRPAVHLYRLLTTEIWLRRCIATPISASFAPQPALVAVP